MAWKGGKEKGSGKKLEFKPRKKLENTTYAFRFPKGGKDKV